jgi:hypothetical protein
VLGAAIPAAADIHPSAPIYETADTFEAPGSRVKIWLLADPLMASGPENQHRAAVEAVELMRREGIELVLVSGASGDMSLSYFHRRIGDEKRKKTASEALHRSLLTTAEYLDLIADKPISMRGVEDTDLYARSLENTALRARFMLRNILRALAQSRQRKAILFVAPSCAQALTREFRENGISYESFGLRISLPLPEERSCSCPAMRPAREALAYELLRDVKPRLWELGEAFGFPPARNLHALLANLTDSSSDVFKKDGSTVLFSWAEGLMDEPGKDPDPLQTDREYDRRRHESFRELVRKMDTAKALEHDASTLVIRQYLDEYEKALFEIEKGKEKKKWSVRKVRWVARLAAAVQRLFQNIPSGYRTSAQEQEKIMRFLRNNRTAGGLPLGYKAPPGYWEDKSHQATMPEVDAAVERLLVAYSVSIYDASLWQMALAFAGNDNDKRLVTAYTQRLLSGRSGDLVEIRAADPIYKYGDARLTMPAENAFFFRIIAEDYRQADPLGMTFIEGFPNHPEPHHEDWKPITGEQAWGVLMGPLQSAWLMNGGKVPAKSGEMKLALSILPALEAMRADNGALYHAPEGTHGKDPHLISNENNCSVYAALGMLHGLLKESRPEEARRIESLRLGILDYMRRDGFNRREGIFYTGGLYVKGKLATSELFAVDCQTWAINALGAAWIDKTFGYGTSYRLWKNTKGRGGYFDAKGILRGVGFTDGHDLLSVEWTSGAILAVRHLALYYKGMEPSWAEELKKDAVTMRVGIDMLKAPQPDGSVAYLYANKRYFIPWGWWANPIPNLASTAWVALIDRGFDPFVLGGEPGVRETP